MELATLRPFASKFPVAAYAPASVDKPVVDKPVVDKPVVDIPVVDKPVVNNPVVDKPVVDKPVWISQTQVFEYFKIQEPFVAK